MIHYQSKLEPVTLKRRYKRFLADVIDASGKEFTVHCPNTGAMTGCGAAGDRIWLSRSGNPKRKYAHTWELTENRLGDLICVNTQQANRLVADSLSTGLLNEYFNVALLRSEQSFPNGHGRADFFVTTSDEQSVYIEVKSCTLLDGDMGKFPDTTSVRALKHVRSLVDATRDGHRAVMIFVAMHTGIQQVSPAFDIDPNYSEALVQAKQEGVEVLAVSCNISTHDMSLDGFIPVLLESD
ncbi:MAG: DNA/RNA nuclease SfsA [Gammaproteobacteria bacterium]|nr:DNA/RNA nuclease SfsA [Gammaproteobacteria bacterium]